MGHEAICLKYIIMDLTHMSDKHISETLGP